jgi:hypothetical protein
MRGDFRAAFDAGINPEREIRRMTGEDQGR